jgi:hypothetical protein
LRKAFASNVVKLAELPRAMKEKKTNSKWLRLAPWAQRFASVRTGEDVRELLRQVPRGVPVSLVAQLWDSTLIPQLAENLPAFRLDEVPWLRRRFAVLKAGATLNSRAKWSNEWAQKFTGYMDRILPPGRCDGYAALADSAS